MFQQCVEGTATLAKRIADSAGASADTEMVARAGVSLQAAFRHFNSYADWSFMLTEAPTILITAPFALTGASASGNASFIDLPAGHSVLPQDFVQGQMFAGVAAGRVTATAATRISFANPFNASLISTANSVYTVTANRDRYDLPSDWKQPYSARLVNAQYTIRYVGRRLYDRSVSSEFTPAGTPMYYDGFNFSQYGKLTLSRPPSQTDRLQLKYYRKMDPTSATADCPENVEPYIVAYAKWHFLLDKADAMDRAGQWKSFAMEGMSQLLKENTNVPDEDLMMRAGHYSYTMDGSPNSTQGVEWDR